MSKLHTSWYMGSAWVWLLWPLSLVFRWLTALRRFLYARGVFKRNRVNVPVVVVGNITVGGNGKTPLVVALTDYLTHAGYRVGVLSRGYKAHCDDFPHLVSRSDAARDVGDEPLLIATRTNAKVVIDPNRSRGAKALVEQYSCNLIVCDDGLQHYALHRDIEIVVMDGRGLGSEHLLPMGPLREAAWRLSTVDCIVHNGALPEDINKLSDTVPQYTMQLQPTSLVNVVDSETVRSLEPPKHVESLSLMAGIGDPNRFFKTMADLGWDVSTRIAREDHADYQRDDIPDGMVVTTEKDAVKMKRLAHNDCWYVPVTAKLSDEFYRTVDRLLEEYAKGKGNHHV